MYIKDYLMLEDENNLPQYKFKQLIDEVDNATLLNYGFLDGGFYTVTGIVPDSKYFCQLNINLEYMYEQQKECVKNGNVDFYCFD